MDMAASNGRLDIVQYLHEHRTEGCSTSAMDNAANGGYLEIVQFLHTHRPEGCTTKAMDQAAAGGFLDLVQLLHDHRTEGCTIQAMTQAACNGHLDIVQFLHIHRTEGCAAETLKLCVRSRRAEVLHHLFDNKLVQVSKQTDFAVLEWDSLEMRTVAYDCVVACAGAERLPFSRAVESACGGWRPIDQELFKFWISKLQPGEVLVNKAMNNAAGASQSKLEALQYLHTHGHGGCTTAAMDRAAQNGHLHIVQFLHQNRSEGCTASAMDDAAGRGHLKVVQILHDHRTEGCTGKALENAVNGDHLKMVKFLCESQYATVGCVRKALTRTTRQDMKSYLQSKSPCQCTMCLTGVDSCRVVASLTQHNADADY